MYVGAVTNRDLYTVGLINFKDKNFKDFADTY